MKDPKKLLLQALDYFKEDIETHYQMIHKEVFQDPIVEMIRNAGDDTVIDLRAYDSRIISDTSHGYDLLAENLQHTNIEALYLPNDINFEQLSALVNSFRENSRLTTFGFGDNIEFYPEHPDDEWVEINKLIATLPETAITNLYLDLTLNLCTPEIIQNLFNLLNLNEKLEELELKISPRFYTKDRVEIAGMPVVSMLEAVANNKYLKNLGLSIKQKEDTKNKSNPVFLSSYETTEWPLIRYVKTEWLQEILESIETSLVRNENLESIFFDGEDIDDHFVDMLIGVIADREKLLDVKFGTKVSIISAKKEELEQAIKTKLVDNLFNNWSEFEDVELISMLEMLKQKEFNFNSTFPEQDGYSLLHMATYTGNIVVFDWLIQNNADPNIISPSDGRNVAHIAAEQNKMEMLKLLSDRYPNLLPRSDQVGGKPLHYASSDEVISHLIDQGVEDNDLFNETFVRKLIERSHLDSLRKVLSRGLEVENELREFAEKISDGEKKEATKALLKEFFDKQQILLTSAVDGNIAAIQSVLRDGLKIKFSGDAKLAKVLLETASTNKNYEVLALLMSQDIKSELNHQSYLVDFTRDEKIQISLLQDKYLSSPTAAPIDYLMSKLTLRGLEEENRNQFTQQFREFLLSDISTNNFLMPILSVVKSDPNLRITLDLSKGDIVHIYSSAAAETRGNTVLQQSEIYVAAGARELRETMGTTIHELCHQACYLIWQNNAIPYAENDESTKRFFTDIIAELRELQKSKSKLPMTIIEALDYDEDKISKELIVRVAQTMVTQEDTQDFESIEPLRKLTQYYKEVFVTKSREFIERHSEEIRSRKISELQKPTSTASAIQSPIDEPSASLKIQSAYRGFRVKKVYDEFKKESREIDSVEATLKKSGYNSALEALSAERKVKNIQWAEKIKSADKNSDGRDKT